MLFDLPKDEPSIIKIIGVGGGGSNAVTHMFKQGIIGVDYAICNTDAQAMNLSPVPIKIALGALLTEGRGAGSKPDVGKRACLESMEEIQDFLEKSTKMVFITAGMGGGTGTGAAPVIAKVAREMGILTVGIVTLPFTFEGRTRVSNGYEGMEELRKNVDCLVLVSNDKLRQIHGNLSISQAFSQADNILCTAAKGIAEIITVPGYVNVDFEDVNTVMRDSGVAIMGTASADGDSRARMAVDEALNSPLLEDGNIFGATNILVNITSGTKEATMRFLKSRNLSKMKQAKTLT
jgi:cell division protein FtsZ